MKRKEIVAYGLVSGAILFLINTIRLSYYSGIMDIETLLLFIGFLALSLGIYLGSNWSLKTKSIKHENDLRDGTKNTDLLTPRELEVLELLSKGMTNQEIANHLFVSLATIKTHTSNIYSKMNVKRRTQAIQMAFETDLIKYPTID